MRRHLAGWHEQGFSVSETPVGKQRLSQSLPTSETGAEGGAVVYRSKEKGECRIGNPVQ